MVELKLYGSDFPYVLQGDPATMAVTLERPRANAAERSWRVTDLRDGSFRLSVSNGKATGHLEGSAADGAVRLAQDLDDGDFGTRWRIVRTDEGQFVLRTVDRGDGGLWLNGSPDQGVAKLGAEGREWEILVN